MPKTKLKGALLVASGLLSMNINFHSEWTKNGSVMGQKPYAHIWACAPNLIVLRRLISQISIFLNEINFISKVSLNIIFSAIYSIISVKI